MTAVKPQAEEGPTESKSRRGLLLGPKFHGKNQPTKGQTEMSIRNKVLGAYKKISPATVKQAADYTKLDYKQVSGAVTQLTEQGKLERVGRGTYVYIWDESEKPVLNTKLEETTVVMDSEPEVEVPIVDDNVLDFVRFTDVLTNQEFLQFLEDHDVPLELINELVLLSYYYQRYVVK